MDFAALADVMIAGAGAQPHAYVVFREELPEGIELAIALKDGFGAEPGDHVIEIAAAGNRCWSVV
jgi:hypothetical protein